MARIAIIVLAVALAVLPLPPAAVERYYSTGLYPLLQSALTSFSNRTSVAWFDVLIVAVVGWWLLRLLSDATRRNTSWLRVGARAVVRTVTMVAVLYVLFVTVWGLNYRRVPLADRLQFDAAGVSPARARDLAVMAALQMNALHDAAHARSLQGTGAIDDTLAVAFHETDSSLGIRTRITTARPKITLLDPYFKAASVDGMTDPYFLETLVASSLLSFERPFVVAHEWSHLAGIADEGEANFAGWVTCMHADAPARYSGWLFLYSETVRGLRRPDRVAVEDRLTSGPRDDLRAIADRIAREVRPVVATSGWRVYDEYLKANRVEAGAASYQQVVRLVLGTAFDENWTPLLRKP